MKLIQCNEMSLGFRIQETLSWSIQAHVSFVMFFLAAKLKMQVCISLTDRSDKTSSCECNSQRSPLPLKVITLGSHVIINCLVVGQQGGQIIQFM